jgi:hypothetical protein
LKSLAKHKVDTKEDIFLYPYWLYRFYLFDEFF